MIEHLKSVRHIFTDSISPAHYVLAENCCALYLNLDYHVAKPDWIYEKINELRNKYQLSLLIVMVNHVDYESLLKEITILAIRTNFTLLLAWSPEEAAKHIENYRLNAEKSPNIIMGRTLEEVSKKSITSLQQCLVDALTSVSRISRSDATSLISSNTFDKFEDLAKASVDELALCPGISSVKAKKFYSLFNRPFILEK